MVISGKGGVGKSTVAAGLALFLNKSGYRVLVYDADEVGSSIPFIFGERGAETLYSARRGTLIVPEKWKGLAFFSVETLMPETSTPLLWEGALRSRFLVESLAEIELADFDVIVYDLPPGTGDELITLSQVLPSTKKSIIVSSPGNPSEFVVRKAILFSQKVGAEAIGLVENMSYFRCPNGVEVKIFGKSTAERLASDYKIPFYVKLPFDPSLRDAADRGSLLEWLESPSELSAKLRELASYVETRLARL